MALKEALKRFRVGKINNLDDVRRTLDKFANAWEMLLFYLEQQEPLELVTTPVSDTSPTNGQYLGYDGVDGHWEPKTLIEGEAIDIAAAADGDLTIGAEDAAAANKGVLQLANDLGGSAAAPLVTGIQDSPVSSALPANGQYLGINASAANWEPKTLLAGEGIDIGTDPNGDLTLSAEDASTVNKGIVQLAGYLGGTAGSPTVRDATAALRGAVALAGDLGGTAVSPEVTGLRGDSVEDAAPSDGEILRWNAGASQWDQDGEELILGANEFALSTNATTQFTWSANSQFSILFPDTSDEQAFANLPQVPRSWIGKNLTLEYHISGDGTAGDCRTVWGLQDGNVDNTTVTGVTTTLAAGNSQVLVTASTTIVLNGSSAAGRATLVIGRDPDHAADNIADRVRLYGARIYRTQ